MVKTLHFSGLVQRPSLPASTVKAVVVCCILDQELAISATSSANSKSHKWSSPSHMMPPALLSVVLRRTQSITIASSSGDRMHPWRTPITSRNQLLVSPAIHRVSGWWWWLSLVAHILLKDFTQRWSVNAYSTRAVLSQGWPRDAAVNFGT